MLEKPKFIQGFYSYVGGGIQQPVAFEEHIAYKVPFDKRSQLLYFRAGNPLDELICIVFQRNGKPMRYFPLGAKASSHVELVVVEDLEPETVLEVCVAAPAGVKGGVIVDIGLVEI